MELFTQDGIQFLFRWGHFLAGIAWIGMLWYFNFVQGGFFKETDDRTRSVATQQLVPRALWWFRWGAMFTFITGLVILTHKFHSSGTALFSTSYGLFISVGAVLGTMMFLNVWLIIWPAQKIVIANAKTVAGGGAANPEAPKRAAKALLASRTNTCFSIPMLFMMGAASHLPQQINDACLSTAYGVTILVILLLEANALKGKLGPMEKVNGVITCGFVLTAVLYGVISAVC